MPTRHVSQFDPPMRSYAPLGGRRRELTCRRDRDKAARLQAVASPREQAHSFYAAMAALVDPMKAARIVAAAEIIATAATISAGDDSAIRFTAVARSATFAGYAARLAIQGTRINQVIVTAQPLDARSAIAARANGAGVAAVRRLLV
jgi:hypothetical protein